MQEVFEWATSSAGHRYGGNRARRGAAAGWSWRGRRQRQGPGLGAGTETAIPADTDPNKKMDMGTSRRKFKRLILNLGIALFKFIFLILLMEGYYLMFYFLSSTFLGRIYSLSDEMSQLVSRIHSHSFLFLVQKYRPSLYPIGPAIYTDYAFTIDGQGAYAYLNSAMSSFYVDEKVFIDVTILASDDTSYVEMFRQRGLPFRSVQCAIQ